MAVGVLVGHSVDDLKTMCRQDFSPEYLNTCSETNVRTCVHRDLST